ncbi:hypothetical protein BGX38DRAFT_1173992 [Terfezia claveryi]|nr:hypothetical protein BGX38DRAFT_1173992 [Terfezia claveryi]
MEGRYVLGISLMSPLCHSYEGLLQGCAKQVRTLHIFGLKPSCSCHFIKQPTNMLSQHPVGLKM